MSITSRSQSSSPDILGPPGDADYLISSPIKPFTGRQSWLSPAAVKRQRTPAKRRRVTLSPTRSAHSIRFDDVLLPGSPTMKLDGRQRSLSPEKFGQDGNVSPWRIRVTLEATQDEENEGNYSPSRKRLRPSTVTTKVPLKDDGSPSKQKTPAKRRGRPRKSDIQSHNGSPWPGSPGNTPGPMGTTPKERVGQLRKNTPRPQPQIISMLPDDPEDEPEDELQDEPTPTVEPMQQQFSPMDITADGSAKPNHQWSPMNLATDGGYDSDSLGADDLPVADLRAPTPAHPQTQANNTAHEYGRATYDTPTIGASEHHFLDNDENIHSTPSKMPSPTRERLGSSARSSRRVGNTVSPRTYPTPTPTSSLADEENQPGEQTLEVQEDTRLTHNTYEHQTEPLVDPTDEHAEFDSIMESEGFTMVSLDTLPSAKQYGLGSSAKLNSNGSGKEREVGRIGDRLKRKLSGTIDSFRGDAQSSTRPSPVIQTHSPKPPLARSNPKPHTENVQAPVQVSYPELPLTRSAEKLLDDTPRRTPISLARVVRVGMALQGTFKPGENEVPGSSNAGRKKRLEGVFSSFSPATQRELRAALGIGQELAMRQAQAAEERAREAEKLEDETVPANGHDDPMGEPQEDDLSEEEEVVDEQDEPLVVSVQSRQKNALPVHRYDFAQTEREQEWQREREVVSRHARDPKNSERLIYIESDEDIPQENPKYASVGHLEADVESVVDEPPLEEEPFDQEIPDDASFDQEPENFEPDVVPLFQPVTSQRSYVEEGPIYEDDDEGSEDIWRQDTFDSEPEHALGLLQQDDQNMEPQATNEDDDVDDIWQLEAKDQSNISQHSQSRTEKDLVQAPSSPWEKVASRFENQDHLSSSPAYVTVEHLDGLHQVPTHIRKLRDQDVDLSAILAEEETPNRARYYNGTSTPRELPNHRLGAPLSSAMKSATSTRKTGQRVRLQPISQSSPGIGSEAEFSYSPAFKPTISHQESIEIEADEPENAFDRAHETDSGYTDAETTTPKPPRQSGRDAPASTWFQRITSLTPRWLKAPNRDDDDSSSSAAASEDDFEDDDKENQVEIANNESANHSRENYDQAPRSDRSSMSPSRYLEESASPPQLNGHTYVPSIEQGDELSSEQGDFDDVQDDISEVHAEGSTAQDDAVEDDAVEGDPVEMINGEHAESVWPRPLPTFGYFSDDHYKALRRIYRMAKRSPERFPYYDAPGRAEIIGDWIWTSDGHHGVPITEVQFAIIDRFVHDLSRADVAYGGSGQVDWTEADLHRRLISIIIGEQIRENQKAKSARGVSVDTWR
ncbi:hypothetical protein PMG11_02385 [Penicillium brasilianum]|uniref:AT DNA binding protein n=1 Tax=Penicillium brasilianum TaxID=104259 RepID=A0A0F7TL38_PENBI|nr:hypothetical protein PMG11_02385 [Penicillium brasilianum]